MQIVELNPIGNFDSWNPIKLEELRKVHSSKTLRQHLLFENDTMRFWNIRLKPHERIPFHKRAQYYSWTCLTDGLAILRNGNGRINMIKFKKRETNYWNLGKNGTIADIENIGEEILELHVIEYMLMQL